MCGLPDRPARVPVALLAPGAATCDVACRFAIRHHPRMESLRGKLLVASPAIVDPEFRQTVVLLAEHTEDGAMGVVLNREADVTVGEALPALAELTGDDAVVHVGGPVSADAVTVLAQFTEPERAALLIDGEVGFIPANVRDGPALAAAVVRSRVFAGHAGWGAGQLEAELDEESWIVEDVRPDDCFTDDPDGLWAAVLRRKGGTYALIATMPADPSLN
jgi:putative transcriptional regulator